jgi:cytochrome d ubiquinol oxidase subunit I
MLNGRRDRYHRTGFLVAFTTAAVAMPLQILVGDVAAREVFVHEPAKFAAIEMLPETTARAPETLGGVLIDGQIRYGLSIPDGASLLAGYRPDTRIAGLDAIPAAVRPPDELVSIVHLAFDVMVGTGFALLALAAWFAWSWWRRRELPRSRWFLRAAALAGIVSIVSLESGWVVTEVGRQPWTVVGLLRTQHAAPTTGNLWPFFLATVALYAAIAFGTFFVLRLLRRRWRAAEASGADDVGAVDEGDVPYGPSRARADAQP